MAQPESYEPKHDYSSELGTTHGGNLDQDFSDIARFSREMRANVSLIQRDDTKLRNKTVHPDSLDSATLAMIGNFTPRGLWATATDYAVKDLVEQGGRGYVCAVAHTSDIFANDRASGYWVILDSSDGSVSPFAAATGTGDAMVVDMPVLALSDGYEFRTRAPGANTVTNPTVAIAGSTITITKHGGAALTAGDYSTGSELTLRYRASSNKLELVAFKAASLAELAAASGASLVGIDQSGTIPVVVSRSVRDELRERRNLKLLGLKTTNSAAQNDSVLLEAATRGGAWFAPEGRYPFTLIPARLGFKIYGDGFGKSIFAAENASGACIQGPHTTTSGAVPNADQVRGFGLDGIEIDGAASAGNGLNMPGISRSVFHVYIHGFASGYGVRFASPVGTHNVGTYYNSFIGSIIRENSTDVLFAAGSFDSGNTNFFFGGHINAPVAGGKCIHVQGSPTNVGFFGVSIESAAANTYLLHHEGATSTGIIFPGCRFEEGVAANGIVLAAGSAGVDLRMATISGGVTITNDGNNHVERTPGQHEGVQQKNTRDASTDSCWAAQIAGESIARFEIRADGVTFWSDGTTQDVKLYRGGADLLQTDDSFFINHNLRVNHSSPAQFTADTHDWTPSSNPNMSVFRVFSDAPRNVTGMTGGVQGRCGRLFNVGSNNIVIQHQNAGSAAANRFLNHTGADITLAGGATLGLWYDSVTSRWRTHP